MSEKAPNEDGAETPASGAEVAEADPCVGDCGPLRAPARDVIWALRNCFYRNPRQARPGGLRFKADVLPRPYEDGPDLSNDELGYGEELKMGFATADPGRPYSRELHRTRRTKSPSSST